MCAGRSELCGLNFTCEQKSHSRAKRREIGASEQRGTQTAPNVFKRGVCALLRLMASTGGGGWVRVGGLLVPIGADFLSDVMMGNEFSAWHGGSDY